MKRVDGETDSPKLIDLRKRELALRAAITAENHRQQRRKERIRAKLVQIVGETLLDYADRTPDFNLLLRGVLKNTTDERNKKLLADTGWL
jgi:hypothetical protein